jgi:hypothetical protein
MLEIMVLVRVTLLFLVTYSPLFLFFWGAENAPKIEPKIDDLADDLADFILPVTDDLADFILPVTDDLADFIPAELDRLYIS